MQHVTTDLQTTLFELQERMSKLVKWRTQIIAQAEELIDQTNREFDEVATPIGRQINELRERLRLDEKTTERRKVDVASGRSHKAPNLSGLDDDEQALYMRLLAANKKRR